MGELNWVAEVLTNHQHATPVLNKVYAYELWNPDACGNHGAIDAKLVLPDNIESEAISLAVEVNIELYRNLDHSNIEVIDPYASQDWYEEDSEHPENNERVYSMEPKSYEWERERDLQMLLQSMTSLGTVCINAYNSDNLILFGYIRTC